MTEPFIERQMVIGFITSTDFLQRFSGQWNPRVFESTTAQTLSQWCLDFFRQYGKAPDRNIETIYTEKLRTGLDKDQAEWIADILDSLSEEYEDGNPEQSGVDSQPLIDQAQRYITERLLRITAEDVLFELNHGNTAQALEIGQSIIPTSADLSQDCDPFKCSVEKIQAAFNARLAPVVTFPKALGHFWNAEFTPGSFIALMGKEKIGKSLLLLEIAFRAVKTGTRTAFFQAGDMTEAQQLRRMAIYLAERSDQDRYCNGMWIPQVDCLLHQTDECNDRNREEPDKLFKDPKEITWENLVIKAQKEPEHKPCHNCPQLVGSPWLKWRPGVQPLTGKEAFRCLRRFGRQYPDRLRLSTHPNETLTVSHIKQILNNWKQRTGFIPQVVLVDYADILAPDPDLSRLDFRHQQSRIWQRLRNLSQEYNCLVATVTQIKADGYDKKLLSLADFSEDKRKFAHVTAMYGINQTPEEKRIGLIRLNELVVRESDFDMTRPVTILQRLQMGRPFLGSWR